MNIFSMKYYSNKIAAISKPGIFLLAQIKLGPVCHTNVFLYSIARKSARLVLGWETVQVLSESGC